MLSCWEEHNWNHYLERKLLRISLTFGPSIATLQGGKGLAYYIESQRFCKAFMRDKAPLLPSLHICLSFFLAKILVHKLFLVFFVSSQWPHWEPGSGYEELDSWEIEAQVFEANDVKQQI